METRSSVQSDQQTREAILSMSANYANNSLWNYVSILSWLRVLRATKVFMIILPAAFGGLASWYSLSSPQNGHLAAAFAALAGVFPIVYVAIGLDQGIAYYTALAGKYRLIHALFENISMTSSRYSDESLVREFDRVFAEYCRVREEAHTVPQRYFVLAKKVIQRGEYSLVPSGHTDDLAAIDGRSRSKGQSGG